MIATENVLRRLDDLISHVRDIVQLQRGSDALEDMEAVGACLAWIVAATNIVEIACASDETSRYVQRARELEKGAPAREWTAHHAVYLMAELLKHLRADIDAGLLTSLERKVSAETYDDLIEHAHAYLDEGRKDPAAVIVGVVFEDTIRRICRLGGIEEAGKTCEPLINALTTSRVFTRLESKEAKMAADLRTNATHAWWERFNADQVRAVIEFTKRILRGKLAS